MTKHGVVQGPEEAVIAAARRFSSPPPPPTWRESCKKLAAQVDLGAVTVSWLDSLKKASSPRHRLMASVPGAADAEHDDWMERGHPSAALERSDDALAAAAKGRQIAVFLDYDSTLSPIVEDPDCAVMTDELKAEHGSKQVVYQDVWIPQSLSDMMHGATNTDLGALVDYSDDLVAAREDEVPSVETLLYKGPRAADAEQGARYYDVLVLPPPPPEKENLMPAIGGKKSSGGSCSPTYAVQVSVDAAAGAKAGDQIAVIGVKRAAGAEAGRGHGSLSALVGVVAASSAATALASGAVGPVTVFGLFALLVGGLSLAMASVVNGV